MNESTERTRDPRDASPRDHRRSPRKRTLPWDIRHCLRWRVPCAIGCVILPLVSITESANAQSATPGSRIVLEPITVEGEIEFPAKNAADRLSSTPGGTDIVVLDELPESANLTLSDSFTTAQGVIIQDFFGGNDQPRVQIRGSGLQQNPVERGILFLKDGLPLNRADGSYIVGLADPRQAEFIEINRGYTANRLGAPVLGGALNFVSPTGVSAPTAGGSVKGGSFGHKEASARGGFFQESVDGFLIGSFSQRDGFRDYNESQRSSLNGNIGFELNDRISTRFFAGGTDLNFDVAGPLPKDLMEEDPTQVFTGPTVVPGTPPSVAYPGPNVVRDQPMRDTTQLRIANRTTVDYDIHLIDLALGYTHTDDTFRFPIPNGIRTTDGGDATAVARYTYDPYPETRLPLVELTAQAIVGSADRRYYLNDAGSQGALLGKGDLEASTYSVTATGNFPVGQDLTLSPAVSLNHATRDFDDTYSAATRPTIAFNPADPDSRLPDGSIAAQDTSYSRDYTGFSPSLALSWTPREDHFLFTALSRSFEPPTYDDLIATVNGTPNSSPGRPSPGNPALASTAFRTPDLDAQTATTLEAGWRGEIERIGIDTNVYYSWIDNELLSLRDVTGASLGAVNADETRHFGVELALDARITDSLTGRLAYTFQDFRFHDDPLRGNNHLAGAPPHVINVDLGYDVTSSLTVGATMKWRPDHTPIDNMNTVYADPFATFDLRAAYEPIQGLSFFGEVRNLFDETYASSTLIVDQAREDQAAFIPGDGRAFYVGATARF